MADEQQIRKAGFEWPKLGEIERRAVVVAGTIDLTATREALLERADFLRRQLDEMQSFRDQWGASWSDVSDDRDDYIREESELREAAAHVAKVIAGMSSS